MKIGLLFEMCTVAIYSWSVPTGSAIREYVPSSTCGVSNLATECPDLPVDARTRGVFVFSLSESVYVTHRSTGSCASPNADMLIELSLPTKSVFGARIR